MNWNDLFVLDVPVLEILVRGSVMYLSIFFFLRVLLKREAGAVGMTDLLVIVLIADAAQNGMAGNYQSITGGLILVATIVFWDYFLDWLGYRFRFIGRLISPPPLMLIKNGVLLRRNLRKELITEDELMSELRQSGVEQVSQVKEAYIEGDGKFSVIPRVSKKKADADPSA